MDVSASLLPTDLAVEDTGMFSNGTVQAGHMQCSTDDIDVSHKIRTGCPHTATPMEDTCTTRAPVSSRLPAAQARVGQVQHREGRVCQMVLENMYMPLKRELLRATTQKLDLRRLQGYRTTVATRIT